MAEYADIGILWQYESDFDDVLIATDSVVIAGGLNEVVVLDRRDRSETLATECRRQRARIGRGSDQCADRLHGGRQHLCVSQQALIARAMPATAAKAWPQPYHDTVSER